MGVTKTDFTRGMQCPKMLWLDAHKREERVIPPEVQRRLDQGNEFGDKAMGVFGDFVEVTTFKPDGRLDFKAMIEKTRALLDCGVEVICEAAFSFYGHYCAVDILRKAGGRYEIYEVKDSDVVDDRFIQDVGFQRYLVTACGVRVSKCVVVHRGSNGAEYAFTDVSDAAKEYSKIVGENIRRLAKIKAQDQEPAVAVGEHCEKPYGCWYYGYCRRAENFSEV